MDRAHPTPIELAIVLTAPAPGVSEMSTPAAARVVQTDHAMADRIGARRRSPSTRARHVPDVACTQNEVPRARRRPAHPSGSRGPSSGPVLGPTAQPQATAAYGASSSTTLPPAPTVTTADPAGTDVARTANDWYALASGATAAKTLLPYGVPSVMATGASPSFVARTATYAFPARHREDASTVTGTSGATTAVRTSSTTSTAGPLPPR